MANFNTKFFETRQYWSRQGDSTQWSRIPTNDVPLDQQINDWLATEGVQMVSVTAPGIYHFWLDTEGVEKCVIIGVVVTYALQSSVSPPAAPAPAAFGGPTDDRSDPARTPRPGTPVVRRGPGTQPFRR